MLHTLRARRGMVVAPHHLAAQAGRDVLRDGGNAIEAAVATAACLAVVYPHMTGIGGDGFWLIHEPDGRVHAIDACGRAAQAATLDFYRGYSSIPWRGPGAANTVAGTVSGWALALHHAGGTLPLQRLLQEAIHHASDGVPVTLGGAQIAAGKSAELRVQPGAYASIFEPHGAPLQEGALLQQPQLARTLRRLADHGLESFYRGALADDIAADLQTLGSPLHAHDLAQHQADPSAPLSVAIHGARLYNHAPPTQGLASLLILALFDRLHAEHPDSYAHLHGLIEATKQAFLIRDAHVGDPAWMTLNAQALLDDSDALHALAARIDMSTALPWPHPRKPATPCGSAPSTQTAARSAASSPPISNSAPAWCCRAPASPGKTAAAASVWHRAAGMPWPPAANPSTPSIRRWPLSTMAASWPTAPWAAKASHKHRPPCSRATPATACRCNRPSPHRAGCSAAPGAKPAPR